MLDPTRKAGPVIVLAALLALAAAPAAAQDAPAEVPVKVEVAVGTGIDRATRSLTGEATSFATADFTEETGQIFCLTRVQGMTPPETIVHAWFHEGRSMARVELDVGSADWRTWSSKRVLPAWTGAWEVKILDANGTVLASAAFEIN